MSDTTIPEVAPQPLENSDPLVRVHAAINLGLSGEQTEEAQAALAAALEDEDPVVRKSAVLGLSYLNSPESVALLLQALEDPHEGVQEMAVEALKQIVENLPAEEDEETEEAEAA